MDGRVSVVKHFSIHNSIQPVQEDRQLVGTLEQDESGFKMIIESQPYTIVLGGKVNLLSGFSILDLGVGTEVSLRAKEIEEQWVAQEIHFQKTPFNSFTNLPRILSLGDMVSFSYQRALHEELQGRYTVSHPPANCGGSSNWAHLNRWLGDYSNRRWEVVLFNAGMLDHQLEKEQYQDNLRRWIETIRPACEQLIWLTTTPIQGDIEESIDAKLVGKVPGRMKLQNAWAAEVMTEYPEVKICDLWNVVNDGRDSGFKEWWASNRPQFNYRQSKLIAKAISETLGE